MDHEAHALKLGQLIASVQDANPSLLQQLLQDPKAPVSDQGLDNGSNTPLHWAAHCDGEPSGCVCCLAGRAIRALTYLLHCSVAEPDMLAALLQHPQAQSLARNKRGNTFLVKPGRLLRANIVAFFNACFAPAAFSVACLRSTRLPSATLCE